MRSSWLVAVTLLVIAVAPHAAAQSGTSCATLTLTHVPPPLMEPRATQDVAFEVRNEAQLAEVTALVRVNFAADHKAAGWSVAPAERSVVIPPGGSASVNFTVTAPAARDVSATLNAVAGGQCSANGQAFPVASIGAVPEVTDSVTLTLAPAQGLGFPGIDALQDVPPVYFLGGLGAVVVAAGAVLAARKRADGFTVETPEPEKPVKAGRGASFPITITNKGRQPDTARFEVGEVPAGWTAFMAVSELTLAPEESRTLWLMVRAPDAADDGAAVVVPVVVRPQSNARREVRVAVRAEVKSSEEDGSGVEGTRVG